MKGSGKSIELVGQGFPKHRLLVLSFILFI